MRVDDDGAPVSDPGPLADHADQFFCPDVPLEVFRSDSAGLAMASFFQAQKDGFASTIVTTADGVNTRVEFYDDRARTQSTFVVLTPAANEPGRSAPSEVDLPARHFYGRVDGSGKPLGISDSVTKLLGWSTSEYLAMGLEDRFHPEDIPRVIESFIDLLGRPGGHTRIRQRFQHRDGSWRWFETTQTNLLATADPHIRTESLDISTEMHAHNALQENEALLRRLNDALPVGVVHLHHSGEVALANEMWREICLCAPGEELTMFLSAIDETEDVRLALEKSRTGGTDVDIPVTFPAGIHDTPRHGELRVRPLRHGRAPFGLLLTLTDVTKTVLAQQSLWALARHDHVTQVHNRFGIEEVIDGLLSPLANGPSSIIAIYFDLDNFKSINDRCGHTVGDEVLAATAEHIKAQLRPIDRVGRLGGDEFIAVLVDTTMIVARSVVRRIEEQLQVAETMISDDLEISMSIGVAAAESGDTFETLVARADAAMYRNKAAKKKLRSPR